MLPEDEPSKGLYKKEEIQLKLDKIPILEKRLDALQNQVTIIKQQIKQLWNQVEKLCKNKT